MPQIPAPAVKSKLIPELMLLSEFTQKAITRQISCHLLASLAEVMGKEFKGPLLQRVKALSQDTNPEVREEMSKVWFDIIKAVGKQILEETVFFDIFKLLEDEVEAIKCQGMNLLMKSMELVSEPFFHKEISPVLTTHVYANNRVKLDEVISQNLGLLVLGCRGSHRAENVRLIKRLLSMGPNIRKAIAFNYPAIVKFLSLCNEIRDISVTLSNDFDGTIRATFAAGFHEALALNKHCKILKKIATKLLEENDTRLIVFKQLKNWSELSDSSQLLIKFIKLLTQPLDWRTQHMLLSNFSECFTNFNMKELLDHLVPLLLHKMLSSCWPVKAKCSELLALIIRNTFYLTRKLDICNIVKEKFAHSTVSHDRLLFIEFIEKVAAHSSKKFFHKHFFDDYLFLACDSVHSVQVKFLMAAPVIGQFTSHEPLQNIIATTNFPSLTCRKLREEVLNYFKGKEFHEKLLANMNLDRAKEQFEISQEIQEIKELEYSKRKTVDELGLKNVVEKTGNTKKVAVRGKVKSESIDPKPRGSKSSAVIKPLISIKKK